MASKPGARAGFWRGDEDSPPHAAGCWGGPAPRTHSRHGPLTVLKAKPPPHGGRRPGTRWAASGPASCWSPLRTGLRQTLQKVFRADSPGDGLVGHGPGAPALAGTLSPPFTGLPCRSSGFPSSHRQADHEPRLASEPAHLHKLRGRAEAGVGGGHWCPEGPPKWGSPHFLLAASSVGMGLPCELVGVTPGGREGSLRVMSSESPSVPVASGRLRGPEGQPSGPTGQSSPST